MDEEARRTHLEVVAVVEDILLGSQRTAGTACRDAAVGKASAAE